MDIAVLLDFQYDSKICATLSHFTIDTFIVVSKKYAKINNYHLTNKYDCGIIF